MQNRTKFYVSFFMILVSFGLIGAGIKDIQIHQGPDGVRGVGFFVTGVLLGIASTMSYYIYKEKKDDVPSMKKISTETLASRSTYRRKK